MERRCVCGRSERFPLCDGSHNETGWSCVPEQVQAKDTVILAASHYLSLAEKWAYRLGATHSARVHGMLRCNELWIISDGTDFERLLVEKKRFFAVHTHIVAVGCDPMFLQQLGPFDTMYTLQDEGIGSLWTQLLQLESHKENTQARRIPRIFLSHAVADERVLLPAVNYMRRYFQAEIFVCSDSILQGDSWYSTIETALREAESLCFAISSAFVRSSFCAFEVGMARALGKRLSLFLLDDTLPPAYIQDVQAVSVPRRMLQRPWLSQEEALLETMMEVATVEKTTK